MVVNRGLGRRGWLPALAALSMLCASTGGLFAQPDPAPEGAAELRPRIGLAERPADDPSAALMANAVTSVLYDRIDATWVQASSATEAARSGVELLIEITAAVFEEPEEGAEPTDDTALPRRSRVRTGPLIEVELRVVQLDRNSGAELALLEDVTLVRELDRSGRYQRGGLWADAVQAVQAHLTIADPQLTVTFTSDHEVQVLGLPLYARSGLPTAADDHTVLLSGTNDIDLIRDRSYVLELRATGRRPALVDFYLGNVPIALDLTLERYPRYAVGAHLRGISWPGLGFRWYPRNQRVAVGFDFTSYVAGLTPFDASGDGTTLFGGHPLIEFAVGADYRFGSPDADVRPYAGLAIVPRFTTQPIGFRFDPILPVALRVGAGLDWRRGRFLQPYARLATDVLWVRDPDFVPETTWSAEYDAVVIQLPIIEVGTRWAF